MADVVQVLKDARAVIAAYGLTKGRLWVGWEPDTIDGNRWTPGAPVCSIGAFHVAGYRGSRGTDARIALADTIRQMPGWVNIRKVGPYAINAPNYPWQDDTDTIVLFNDDPRTTLQDVLDVFDATIARLAPPSDPELKMVDEPPRRRLSSHRQRVPVGVE